MTVGFPKPEPRKRAKGRKRRRERQVVQTVRPQVAARDGYCRGFGLVLVSPAFGACVGPSEWAHWRAHSRAKTRGMPPDVRHRTDVTLMLCDFHHDAYDEGRLLIRAQTPQLCDGLLAFKMKGGDVEYLERAA